MLRILLGLRRPVFVITTCLNLDSFTACGFFTHDSSIAVTNRVYTPGRESMGYSRLDQPAEELDW